MSSSKIRLGINIDHVATLRQQRGGLVNYPDVRKAAEHAIKGGADQITVHLRGDRRHIQDFDLWDLATDLTVPLNLEMAATEEMAMMAKEVKPHIVCLVPEKREELTTEGGLDVLQNFDGIQKCISLVKREGIQTSLFIEPEPEQVLAAKELKVNAVEFHTGPYANAEDDKKEEQLEKLFTSFDLAKEQNLQVHAGHGLDYENTQALVQKNSPLEELNIGHSVVCQSVFVGMEQAVRDMKKIVEAGS